MEFKTKGIIELEYKIESSREFLSNTVGRLENLWRNSSGKPLEDEERRAHDLARIILNLFNMRFPQQTTNEQTELPKDEYQNNT